MSNSVSRDPRERAEELIGAIARREGRKFSSLPQSDMIAYGPVTFVYEPRTQSVVAAILLIEIGLWTTYPEDRPAIEKTLAGLADPKIGGMFDTGGGEWIFDRATGQLFLGIRRPVDTPPAEMIRAFERVQHVYPDWRLEWFSRVADMVHEGEPLPLERVTVERNPYRRD